MTDLDTSTASPGVPEWATLPATFEPFTESPLGALEVYKALVPVLGKLENVHADATGNAGRAYKYATLGAVMSKARETLAAGDLGVIQGQVIEYAEGPRGTITYVTVTARLIHVSGQWLETRVALAKDGVATPQEVGSAMTYGRRYGISALLGLAPTEDEDDGAAASQRQSGRQSDPGPAPDPFAGRPDTNADGELLVTKPDLDRIYELSQALSPTERTELTTWREGLGIKITPALLTNEQAQSILDRLDPGRTGGPTTEAPGLALVPDPESDDDQPALDDDEPEPSPVPASGPDEAADDQPPAGDDEELPEAYEPD